MPNPALEATKGLWGKGTGFLGFAFKKFGAFSYIFFSFILITLMLPAIMESIHEKSYVPLLYGTVGRLLAPDENIYEQTLILESKGIEIDFEEKDTFLTKLKKFWEQTKVWWSILASIFMIYYMFKIVFKAFDIFNETNSVWPPFKKTFVVIVLSTFILSNLLLTWHIIEEDEIGKIEKEKLKEMTDFKRLYSIGWRASPFKGIVYFGYKMVTDTKIFIKPTFKLMEGGLQDAELPLDDYINETEENV